MGLTPEQFWNTTLAEWMARVAGHNRAANGGRVPMTRERLNELLLDYGAPSQSIRAKKQ